METKVNWFIRLSKWSWSPIILGIIVCLLTIIVSAEDAIEAAPAGFGILLFVWIAVVKGRMK